MRLSTSFQIQKSIAAITERQSQIVGLQNQLASGKRVNTPGDDPAAASQIELARARTAQLDSRIRVLSNAQGQNQQIEQGLADATSAMQDARDALVAAGNGAYSDAERRAQAEAIRGAFNRLLAIANSEDGAGGRLFGGVGSQGAPFVPTAGGVSYVGNFGDQMLDPATNTLGSLDGSAIFMQLPSGNGTFSATAAASNTGRAWADTGSVTNMALLTGDSYEIRFNAAGTAYDLVNTTTGNTLAAAQPYTSGQSIGIDGWQVTVSGAPGANDRFVIAPSTRKSIFATLQDAVTQLSAPGQMNAGKLQQLLAEIDTGMSRASVARAKVGEQMRTGESIAMAAGREADTVQGFRSKLEDVDVADAISKITAQQTSLEAAMKTYASVAKMSLMNYI